MKILVRTVFLASASSFLSSLLNFRLTSSTFDKILKTDKFCQSIGQTCYNLEEGLALFSPVVQNGKLIGILYAFSLFPHLAFLWVDLWRIPVCGRDSRPVAVLSSWLPRVSMLHCAGTATSEPPWRALQTKSKSELLEVCVPTFKKKKSGELTTSYPCILLNDSVIGKVPSSTGSLEWSLLSSITSSHFILFIFFSFFLFPLWLEHLLNFPQRKCLAFHNWKRRIKCNVIIIIGRSVTVKVLSTICPLMACFS